MKHWDSLVVNMEWTNCLGMLQENTVPEKDLQVTNSY